MAGSSQSTLAGPSLHPSGWRAQGWPALLLLLLPFLLYFPTLRHGYVLDDKIVLSENRYVQQGLGGLGRIFSEESMTGYLRQQVNAVVGARYRPLSLATFAVEIAVFGPGRPGISHLVNVLLYALSGWLVYRFLRRLLPQGDRAWWLDPAFYAALLFVLHPVHAEVVANIKGRDEILALLLGLGMLGCCWRFLHTPRPTTLVLGGLLFFLALLSKENALMLLVAAPLMGVLLTQAPARRILLMGLPLLVAAVAFVWLRTAVVGYLLDSGTPVTDLMNNPYADCTTGQKYATITFTLGWYLKLMVWPHPLTHDYYPHHVPIVGWGSWQALGALALVLLLLGVAAWGWRKGKVLAFGILFFFLALGMVSNLFFPVGVPMGERFLYLPSLGFCIAVAHLLGRGLPGGDARGWGAKLLLGLLTVAMGAMAWRTATRVPDWRSAAALEEAAIRVSPNSARSNQYYAFTRFEMAMAEPDPTRQKALLDEAWRHVGRALEIYPAYSDAHTCRALVAAAYYERDGRIDRLLGYFGHTIRVQPVPFVDAYLDQLVAQGRHVPELVAFFHRIGYEFFWRKQRNAREARFYLDKGLRLAPGDRQLQADWAAVR